MEEYECLDCGGFFCKGAGYNNCEPEFCDDECLASFEGSLIDAAMDRAEDELIYQAQKEGER